MDKTYYICGRNKEGRLFEICSALYRLEKAPKLSDSLLCLALCFSKVSKDYIKENGIVGLGLYSDGFGKNLLVYLDLRYFSKGVFDI